MKRPNWVAISITAGIFLLAAGVQFRAVESFVLTPQATRLLAEWFGPAANTAEGAFQRLMIDNTAPRKVLNPPRWLGWAALSTGAVLLANGLLMLKKKKK